MQLIRTLMTEMKTMWMLSGSYNNNGQHFFYRLGTSGFKYWITSEGFIGEFKRPTIFIPSLYYSISKYISPSKYI